MNPQLFDWRAFLKVHPAAELFPLMSEADLKELAEDIRVNGLRTPFISWLGQDSVDEMLLDGRNRLDALAQLGLLYETPDHHIGLKTWTSKKGWADLSGNRISTQYCYRYPDDPYALALSYNVHRRHLTAEQKRDLIAKLVTAKPELSDRQLGKMAKASKNTVAAVRNNLESRGQVDHVEKREDTKGRKQPSKKKSVVENADVERDRKDCIALYNKVQDAEREAAAAAKPRVSPADTALREFNGHICRLLQMTNKAKPERFARTSVNASDLSQLGHFLAEVAETMRATHAEAAQ